MCIVTLPLPLISLSPSLPFDPHYDVSLSTLQYLKLRECEEIQDPDQRLKQLQECHTMFQATPALEKNAHYIEESIKLLKKQKEIKVWHV